MKPFEYATPETLNEATALLDEAWGKTEILAGGTDLITALKQQITSPKRLVSLRKISELKRIRVENNALHLGAMVTLAELAKDQTCQQHLPALTTSIENIGSPQILAAGTVGGDLCQRPRCWYFRNGFGLLATQGGKPLVPNGDNRYHAIFGTDGPALFVSPSSLGPSLLALEATIAIVGPGAKTRQLPASQFFRTPRTESERETALKPNEILTEIRIPLKGLRNAAYEVRHRHGLDWPYVSASVAFELRGGRAANSRIVLGHVAPVPYLAEQAGTALNGSEIDPGTAARIGEVATKGAKPLSGNAYKVQLVKAAVKRALLAAA